MKKIFLSLLYLIHFLYLWWIFPYLYLISSFYELSVGNLPTFSLLKDYIFSFF